MSKGPFTSPHLILMRYCTGLVILFLSSCTIVKNYPANKPFVYKTNITVNGDFSNEDRAKLVARLKTQLDDSMKSRSVSKIFWSVMKHPPEFETPNADKSVLYMRALLTSLGYFKDTITYKADIDTVQKDQLRATVNFNVTPGKVVRIDSFAYNIKQAELQALATQTPGLIKKGDPFAKATISDDLDRLVTLYRDHGFMRFSREELIGLWDTLDVSLLQPTFDPLEQVEILQKLKERRENPTADLEIRLRPGFDSSKLIKYYVGNITIFPDIGFDTTGLRHRDTVINGVTISSYQHMFKPKILPQNSFLRHGDLYDQRNYYRTVNRFNSLNTWRLVNIDPKPRPGQDTADFVIRLTPAKKYSFTANLEGSRNNTLVSGNLFGIGMNVGLQNRNFARSASIASTNIRFGIETGRDTATKIKFLQTKQISINHTITFPRPIPRMNWLGETVRSSFRTQLIFNVANTQRRELYNLNTINGSWGYEFQWGKKLVTLRVPNIEYSSFNPKKKLLDIFATNPSLRNIFADGFISSMLGGVKVTGGRNKHVNTFSFNAEVSGLLTGLIRHNDFLDTNLLRFVKADAEFSRKISLNKSSLVLHAYAGAGYEFESTVNENRRYNLPLLRQYFAGGPNSMRAWGLRKLGPGSTVQSFGTTGLPDRYGDLHLEANIEYRFPLLKAFGFPVEGALFSDIGNIWYLKTAPGRPPEQIFSFNRLGKDIAVGVGTGFRIDLSFFVIRLDYSIKAKDPSPAPDNKDVQNKWFGYKNLRDADQFQLAISYPFVL
ncbi:MAG: BamA/TamA family outer membrane protein [Chitinophagaceae bacterium]